MDNPIKIIYKYKNDNRKTQYQYYIFVGPLMSTNLKKIFTKIQDLSFFDTLIILTDKELSILTEMYGETWYKFFFLSDHITYSIKSIVKNVQKRYDIINKYNREWYDTHIVKNTFVKKSEYSFSSIFERNNYTKYKQQLTMEEQDMDEINDYRTIGQVGQGYVSDSDDNDDNNDNDEDDDSLEEIKVRYNFIGGGNKDEDDDDNDEEEVGEDDFFTKQKDPHYEGESVDLHETFDIEELSAIYKEDDTLVDDNPEHIKDMIDKALEKTKSDDDKRNKHIKFNKAKGNLAYDDSLKHVAEKQFVFEYYILKDDTIKTIKQKITMSIENNNIFSKTSPYIIPSRIYLWSEYEFIQNEVNKIDKIMLGQKWIKRGELLFIDIEPNNDLSIYEKLKGNMRLLNESIKKYGSKIKFEDDENNILDEYEGYYTNNEIFMIDIYNELGSGYSGSHNDIKNLYNMYCKIYFNKIEYNEFVKIIDYVSLEKEKMHSENTIISSVYQNIFNDMVMEREIVNTIEQVKIDKIDYQSLLKSNYVIQAVIHVNLAFELRKGSIDKINLYRIFDSFVVNEIYPFLQYQVNGDRLVFKFNQENREVDKDAIAAKWFENSPYGINFKIKVDGATVKGGSTNKYIAVTMYETGRLEYKSTWKEDDHATNDDVIATYQYIKDLINKINIESGKVNIIEPKNHDFRYAFINTIQHFEFPKNITINHNDMSDFARYFYPYVAVVIDPKKRLSKKQQEDTKSKYGSYFRFKKISGFDTESKIEHRIVYFLRNYEFIPNVLATEISKQFNITEEEALLKIEEIVNKFPLLKKSRKILKKLQNIPKFKPPGIAVDIQGKKRENYKIRIDGARSEKQLQNIIEFMTILLWLYMDTYINKNPERLVICNRLKLLTNIAKRRHSVEEIVVQQIDDSVNIKKIIELDHERLQPGESDIQWPRVCQKSGDKNRRTDIFTDKTFDKMIKLGYKLNPESGDYERKISLPGKTKKDVIIKAAKFTNNSGSIYYTCSPETNGEYMFIGFLSRSSNTGMCVPCCYKKDPGASKNKYRRNFHLQCMGKDVSDNEYDKDDIGDKLYILQDTNKMLPGRYGYPSKYLDYYFNSVLNKDKVIKNNYLVESKGGYFMKFGSKQDKYPYLNALAPCLDIGYDDIILKIEKAIKDDSIWSYANNGDLKTQFTNRETFIDTLKTNEELDHVYTDDIISVPGVLSVEGLNIYIFEKNISKTRIDFVLLCKNIENIIYYHDPMRKNIILVKEDLNYYPIMLIHKDIKDKQIQVKSLFDKDDEIIQHIMNYLKLSCNSVTFDSIKIESAKNVYYNWFSNNKSNILPTAQYIDSRNKCTFLIIDNKFAIPVKPSGCIYHLPINDNFPIPPINELIEFIKTIQNTISIDLHGFVYDVEESGIYNIISVILENESIIHVVPQKFSAREMNEMIPDYIIKTRTLYDEIDHQISKGSDNYMLDERLSQVKRNEFEDEHYELFRYELSHFLNMSVNIKNKIIKILQSDEPNKKSSIKDLLLKNISEELFDELNQSGGAPKFIDVNNDKVDANKYTLNNNRELCSQLKNSKDCGKNIHCNWNRHCMFSVTQLDLLKFLSRVSSELVHNEMKSKEILNIDEYYVLDVIDINNYTYRDGQKIIKSDNINIRKILGEMFGKSNIPTIGKRRLYKLNKTLYDDNNEFPMEKIGQYHYQTIVSSNPLFRAYSNGIYWQKNNMSDPIYRNLGYYSDLQTELSNTFKSYVYTWISTPKLMKSLYNYIKDLIKIDYQTFYEEFRTKIFLNIDFYYMGIVDLLILNKQHDIPIVLTDYYDSIFLIIDNGIKYNNLDASKSDMNVPQYNMEKCIKIKYKLTKLSINSVPEHVQSVY